MEHEYELFHHGIKGQKWGVRRFQRKDGSLTPAGKKRARDMSDEELSSSVKRMTLEKTYDKLSKDRQGSSKLEKAQKVANASSRLVDDVKKLERETRPAPAPKTRMNLSKMTDQQLRERITRENLERQYNDLFNPQQAPTVSRGRKIAQGIIEGVGTAIAITGGALGIAVAIKELKG